jgi:predicted RNA-binding Zn ribbon-like protein
MDEQTKRRVGEQVEPGGRRKAPGRLALLQRFVNTWNHDFPPDWDRLAIGARATRWLRVSGLIPRGGSVGDARAAQLRDFRESLRDLIRANGEQRPSHTGLQHLHAVSVTATLRVQLDDRGRTALAPARQGVEGIAAELLAIVHDAQQAGLWERLKACRCCEYVFYDRSRNRSAAWCAMAICGNRVKNRAYRRRLAK